MPTRFLARLLPLLGAGWLIAGAGLALQPRPECREDGPAAVEKPADTSLCSQNGTTLCLQARFQVQLTRSPATGNALPITSDTGAFWFSSAGNPEVVVSVLDGRPLNSAFWVFVAGLSNLPFTLTITDTVTLEHEQYVIPNGQLASFGDTCAFPVTSTGPCGASGARQGPDTLVASFSYTPAAPIVGEPIRFTTSLPGGVGACWDLDYQSACACNAPANPPCPTADLHCDGSGAMPTCIYTQAGCYNVHLEFTNGPGSSPWDEKVIVRDCRLTAAPRSSLAFGPMPGAGAIDFTVVAAKAPSSCRWSVTTSGPNFITLLKTSDFTSNPLQFTVSRNTDSSPREETIIIEGVASFMVTQQGAPPSPPSCTPSATALCLLDRFKVSASASGKAMAAVPGSGGATGWGTFGFTGPLNVQVVVKIVDGTSINKHFWFFLGDLTTVPYVVTVTDTQSGKSKSYSNGPGGFLSQADMVSF